MKELKDIRALKAENKELRTAWSELVERDDAKVIVIKQFQAKTETLEVLLKKTENLAIGICEACLTVVDDEPTIGLIKRTLKELKAANNG